jgi:putative ABC transport system permease protein
LASLLTQHDVAQLEPTGSCPAHWTTGEIHRAGSQKTRLRIQAGRWDISRTVPGIHQAIAPSEILKLAIDSLRASKTRFALTALGMVIGTASVILVVTIGLTGKQYILAEIQKIGTNSVELEYAAADATAAERVVYDDFLTREDEKAVVAQVPAVLYSSPILEMHNRINFGEGLVKDNLVLGVSPQYQNIRNLLVLKGRFFDEEDDAAHTKSAVVTEPFARDRYGTGDAAIGQVFAIQGLPFTIIGVFRESVDDFGQSEIADQTVLIPYSVARYFTGSENVKQIYFSMNSMEAVPAAAEQILHIIQIRHRRGSVYKAQTLKELLTMASRVANALTAVLVLVAAVTLVVGGVGIMNIMLANTNARTREIGIRKALGATHTDIRLQFLTEAVIISLSGGIVGIVVGLALPFSVRFFTDFAIPISSLSIVTGITAAILVGVIFGTYPATRAAHFNPVEALKYE